MEKDNNPKPPKPGYIYIIDRFPSHHLGYKIGRADKEPSQERQKAYNTFAPENRLRFWVRTNDMIGLENVILERLDPYLIPHKSGKRSEVVRAKHLDTLIPIVFQEAKKADITIYEYKRLPLNPPNVVKQPDASAKPYRDRYFYKKLGRYLLSNSYSKVMQLYSEYSVESNDWPHHKHRNAAFDLAMQCSDYDIVCHLVENDFDNFVYLINKAMSLNDVNIASALLTHADEYLSSRYCFLDYIIDEGSVDTLAFVLEKSKVVDPAEYGCLSVFLALKGNRFAKIRVLLSDSRVKKVICRSKVLDVAKHCHKLRIIDLIGDDGGTDVDGVGYPARDSGFWY